MRSFKLSRLGVVLQQRQWMQLLGDQADQAPKPRARRRSRRSPFRPCRR